MQTLVNANLDNINKLKFVVEAILSQCDGAKAKDGVGFNKFDSERARQFLANPESTVSDSISVYRFVIKYTKQILNLGISDVFGSISFDVPQEESSRVEKESSVEIQRQNLLQLIAECPPKPILKLNKFVKALNITNDNKWIWEVYKHDKSWFKENGLSVYKNTYNGDVWQVQKWGDLVGNKPTPPPTEDISHLIRPDSIELSHSDKLLSYQVDHVKYLMASLKNFNAVLDASDTGTGKTFSALACAKELNLIPFVLTPKSVIPSWIKACKHFDIKDFYVTNYEAIKTGKTPYLEKRSEEIEDEYVWNLPSNAILIFDEVHRCKNRDTLNAKLLLASKKCNLPVICLSATIADNPTQLYAVGNLLDLYGNRGYNKWLISLGGQYNHNEMRFEFSKESLKKVNSQIFPLKGHRISIKDLGDLFPETAIHPETFTVSEATQKSINSLYDTINTALDSLKKKTHEDRGHHLTELLRARQQIELLKIPIFVELAEDMLAENNSVVIIVNFTETLELLAKKLNTKCVIHGSQTAQEREKNIADFQSDKERVIILNIRSGGVGVSLHDLNGNHPRFSLISPSWSAQDIVQAVGRVWRAGSKSHSIQKIVYCADTVEEDICETMKYKIDNINIINESSVSDVFASLGEEA